MNTKRIIPFLALATLFFCTPSLHSVAQEKPTNPLSEERLESNSILKTILIATGISFIVIAGGSLSVYVYKNKNRTNSQNDTVNHDPLKKELQNDNGLLDRNNENTDYVKDTSNGVKRDTVQSSSQSLPNKPETNNAQSKKKSTHTDITADPQNRDDLLDRKKEIKSNIDDKNINNTDTPQPTSDAKKEKSSDRVSDISNKEIEEKIKKNKEEGDKKRKEIIDLGHSLQATKENFYKVKDALESKKSQKEKENENKTKTLHQIARKNRALQRELENMKEAHKIVEGIEIPKKDPIIFFFGCKDNTEEIKVIDKKISILEKVQNETAREEEIEQVKHLINLWKSADKAIEKEKEKKSMKEGESLAHNLKEGSVKKIEVKGSPFGIYWYTWTTKNNKTFTICGTSPDYIGNYMNVLLIKKMMHQEKKASGNSPIENKTNGKKEKITQDLSSLNGRLKGVGMLFKNGFQTGGRGMLIREFFQAIFVNLTEEFQNADFAALVYLPFIESPNADALYESFTNALNELKRKNYSITKEDEARYEEYLMKNLNLYYEKKATKKKIDLEEHLKQLHPPTNDKNEVLYPPFFVKSPKTHKAITLFFRDIVEDIRYLSGEEYEIEEDYNAVLAKTKKAIEEKRGELLDYDGAIKTNLKSIKDFDSLMAAFDGIIQEIQALYTRVDSIQKKATATENDYNAFKTIENEFSGPLSSDKAINAMKELGELIIKKATQEAVAQRQKQCLSIYSQEERKSNKEIIQTKLQDLFTLSNAMGITTASIEQLKSEQNT